MVTASADKTQQEAQTPDRASQWWLVFRASAGGVIVASRPAEACLLRLGTGKQADWGRPLVGPVTGTTCEILYGTVRYSTGGASIQGSSIGMGKQAFSTSCCSEVRSLGAAIRCIAKRGPQSPLSAVLSGAVAMWNFAMCFNCPRQVSG